MRFIDSCYWIQGHFWFSCPCCSPLLVLLLSIISFQLNIYLWPQALMCLKFSPVGRTTCLCSSKSHCLPAALIDSHSHLWTRYQNQKIWKRHFRDSRPTPGTGIFLRQREPNVGEGWFPKGLYQCPEILSQEQLSAEQDAVVFFSVKRIFHGLKAK